MAGFYLSAINLKPIFPAEDQQLRPVILAAWKDEIRKITV
jgi:hypothetical protein